MLLDTQQCNFHDLRYSTVVVSCCSILNTVLFFFLFMTFDTQQCFCFPDFRYPIMLFFSISSGASKMLQIQSLEPSAAHGFRWLPSLVADAARPPPSRVLSHVAECLHKSCARRRHLPLRTRLLESHCHTRSKAQTRSAHLRHTGGFSRVRLVLLRRKQGPSHVLHVMLDIRSGFFEEPALESQPLRVPRHGPHRQGHYMYSPPKRPRAKNLYRG